MSNDFNENLSMFLTSRKESALKELTENNSEYKNLCSEATELSVKLRNESSGECYKLIERFLENFHARIGAEVNHLYLQGFKDCVALHKRFDDSFRESREFWKLFVGEY